MKETKIEFKVSKKEFYEIKKIASGKNQFKIYAIGILTSLLVGIFFGIPSRAIFTSPPIWYSSFQSLLCGISSCIFLIFWAYLASLEGDRVREFRNEYRDPIEIILSDKNITWKTVKQLVELDWSDVFKVINDQNYLILFMNNEDYIFLKKSQLPEIEQDFIFSKLNNHET